MGLNCITGKFTSIVLMSCCVSGAGSKGKFPQWYAEKKLSGLLIFPYPIQNKKLAKDTL